MTIADFLEELRLTRGEFPWRVKVVAGRPQVRADKSYGCACCPLSWCPVTAVARNKLGTAFLVGAAGLAGQALGLSEGDTLAIVAAADGAGDSLWAELIAATSPQLPTTPPNPTEKQ